MTEAIVGTCGYGYYSPPEGWTDEYESKLAAFADAFPTVELNKTFYTLPQVSTAERWRTEAGADFTFTMKAWQAVTHPWSSPTWNSYRDALPDGDADIGYFRPTDAVFDAWVATRERAHALDAEVVLFQTPPSFDATAEHEANLDEFFETIDRGGLTLAWEPRGDWPEHPDRVAELCRRHDLVHAVDPFRDSPVDQGEVGYLRLHGRNDDLHDYDYDYADDELRELAGRVADLGEGRERVYCMFNNYEMYENAARFGEMVADREPD